MTIQIKIEGFRFMANSYKDLSEIVRKNEEFIIINESEFGPQMEETCKEFRYFKQFTRAMKNALDDYADKVSYGDRERIND